ncbi:MAG: cobalamin-dependent protein, partial [Dehalococcoidia bacterium]|nr:cobalamin-dependent protein [Dehalococcoidia bacterium]
MAAAYVDKMGFTSRVVDAIAYGYSKEDTVSLVKGCHPRLVTVATSTPSIHQDIAMADQLKHEVPEATVIMVGRHASWDPEETLERCSAADGVIRNEYYRACADILSGRPMAKVGGAVYRDSGRIISNPE